MRPVTKTVLYRAGIIGIICLLLLLLLSTGGDGDGTTTPSHTVSASASTGGIVSPAGTTVNHGATTDFTLTSDTGYGIADVTGCGGRLTGNTYTTGAISADCTVTADFVLNSYTVIPTAGANGRINPATPQTVNHGATTNFTLTPDTGYVIAGITGCVGRLSGNTYTTGAMTADCTLRAGFIQTHTVDAPASTGGIISPAGATVKHGATTNFTLTSDTGYGIAGVTGCDGSLSGNTYTTGAVTTDCTVQADFIQNYTVDAPASAGGIISPPGATVNHNATTDFTLTPDTGYGIAGVTGCDGRLSGNTYTTDAITADCTVTADFVQLPPAAPTLLLTLRNDKTFSFSWTDVSGETEYRLLENPDGVSGYTQVASPAANATSYDHEVLLLARINAGYILQACNAAGCSDSSKAEVFVSNALAYVKASNTGVADQFGWSVALSSDGNTLAVGAYLEDSSTIGVGSTPNEAAASAGAVYVFTRSNAVWSEQAYLKASNTGAGDRFGQSVTLSGDGNTLAVGAFGEDSSTTGVGSTSNENAVNAGAVYVFTRSGADWSEQAYIKASNTGVDDQFGYSVALSSDGSTLAVGAIYEDGSKTSVGRAPDNATIEAGAAYVFTRSGEIWSEQAYVKASSTGVDDQFGWSVALSGDGNTLAVAAYLEDSSTTGVGSMPNEDAVNAGAVYVFTRNNAIWSEQAYVKASNTGAGDLFGRSVALSSDGNTLAVGAIREDSSTTGVGSIPNEAAGDAGAVYVFTRSGALWSEQAYVKASNTGAVNWFGITVALSGDGNTLTVGGYLEDSSTIGVGSSLDEDAGSACAVYVFTRSDALWSQQSYVKASNTGADDLFGRSVALSGDGNTLAVGAIREDSSTTGVDTMADEAASEAGVVYLY